MDNSKLNELVAQLRRGLNGDQKAREKKGSVKMIHGSMFYRCKDCGEGQIMYLETGVEDGGRNGRPHQPCPFVIGCRKCGGMMRDVSGYQPFPTVRSIGWLPDLATYFAYDDSGDKYACGKYRTYHKEELCEGETNHETQRAD